MTVLNGAGSGFVTVLPTAADGGGGTPGTSTVNVNPLVARANQSADAVGVGAAQTVNVYASVATDVVVDVVGYYAKPRP